MTGRVCCIYIRCSADEQVRAGYSLEYQEEKCKEYIQKKGFNYFRTYIDTVSGTVPGEEREGLQVLFQDMKLKKFNTVVLYTFDRLGCELTVAYRIVGLFDKNKITLLECQNDIDPSNADGEHRMAMSLVFAQMEYFKDRERSKLDMDKKMKLQEV